MAIYKPYKVKLDQWNIFFEECAYFICYALVLMIVYGNKAETGGAGIAITSDQIYNMGWAIIGITLTVLFVSLIIIIYLQIKTIIKVYKYFKEKKRAQKGVQNLNDSAMDPMKTTTEQGDKSPKTSAKMKLRKSKSNKLKNSGIEAKSPLQEATSPSSPLKNEFYISALPIVPLT